MRKKSLNYEQEHSLLCVRKEYQADKDKLKLNINDVQFSYIITGLCLQVFPYEKNRRQDCDTSL